MGNVCSDNTASGSKFSRSLLICVELQLAILTVLLIKKGEDIAAIIVTPPPPPPPPGHVSFYFYFRRYNCFPFSLTLIPVLSKMECQTCLLWVFLLLRLEFA